MREIKFRAWEPQNKQMYFPSWPMLAVLFDRTDREGIELMQWTGLTDKNGKEIYEGDIVEYEHRAGIQGHDEKWVKSRHPFVFKAPNFMYQLSDRAFREIFQENMEVVGNIYENPDLLAV